MTITETNFMWFVVGDIVMIYVFSYGVQWIIDKIWWWYVDKVLEGYEPESSETAEATDAGAGEDEVDRYPGARPSTNAALANVVSSLG